jgi:ABC-type polysaccharide/polyol phosphate transport system ATPase subunit
MTASSHQPQTTIALENVSVSFPLYHGGSRSLKKSVMNLGSKGRIGSDASDRVVVEALRDVTMQFAVGDRVALIGANGAGKTTLLRVMAGIYEPTSGVVQSVGRISPMFDIGLGIDMELSGFDNIKLRALLLGLTVAEIEERTAEIAEFTELKEYLELPVRTYSSGMITRLTFAVATCFFPEILLMDEWILAGDASFMTKAESRVSSFVENASTLVLASHSPEICKRWCNKAVWLEAGQVKSIGEVNDILSAYQEQARSHS